MRTIIIIMAFVGSSAFAATKHSKSLPAKFMVNGAEVPVQDALLSSIKGQEVYKCQVMETKVSKSGTSIALKTKKLE